MVFVDFYMSQEEILVASELLRLMSGQSKPIPLFAQASKVTGTFSHTSLGLQALAHY